MKRLIDHYLHAWKHSSERMPLLIRGARQVGKTYAVRELGKTFDSFVEINFEVSKSAGALFEKDLFPEALIQALSLYTGAQIVPGKTLLFIDEIQRVPRALTALRYFHEMMPNLHVIAAGSLVDFAVEQVGLPVGRIQPVYMYPLSFLEFLAALKESLVIKEIITHEVDKPLIEPVHEKILGLVGQYLALGGMPKIVQCWVNTKNALSCSHLHASLIDTYRQDFGEYGKERQLKYLEELFERAPYQLGKKFKFSEIGEYRKRELEPALQLLETAGVLRKVISTAAQGIPLGAQADPNDFKILFLDVGLTQSILNYDLTQWFLNPEAEFVNKRFLVESFVGQELLAYADPYRKQTLFYWHRETRTSQAEVDYVIQERDRVVPIEVKSSLGTRLKSLHSFLESHEAADYGIRFSAHNYSRFENIHSYPLYAVAKIGAQSSAVRDSIEALVRS